MTSAERPKQAPTLSYAEDPTGRAVEIENRWRVLPQDKRLQTGSRTDEGRMRRSYIEFFKKGDFVDCTVTFDIVRLNDGRVNAHLAPLTLVMLKEGAGLVSNTTKY